MTPIVDRSAKRQDPQGLGPQDESDGAGTAIAKPLSPRNPNPMTANSELKATPGPWTAYKFGADWWVANGTDDSGPMLRVGSWHDAREANAHLIAEAPSLYAALADACEEIRELRHYANNHGAMFDEEEFAEGLAALSRARGNHAPPQRRRGMIDEKLIEAVARALWVQRGLSADTFRLMQETQATALEVSREEALAVIPIVLEAAAKVADDEGFDPSCSTSSDDEKVIEGYYAGYDAACRQIGRRIRSLGEGM